MALKLGSIDEIALVYDPAPFQNWHTIKIEANDNSYNIVTLFFNTQDKYLSEKSLRQALYYAIQKDEYGVDRASSPIPPLSWAYNPQIKSYDYNPERAKELITELPDELKQDLNIQLVTTPSLLTTAEKISKDWKEVGIQSHLLVSSTIPSEFQVFLAIFDPPNDPDQYSTWHSTQTSTNISRYKNPRIDKLLEDGRLALDMEERRKIYLDFQRFLLEDVPAAFLYYPRVYTLSRK
jgi:peptide/nickel transport system substrate-binding protein